MSAARRDLLTVVIALVVLGLAVYVALHPAVAYAPVQRIVLFILVGLLPAILFASTAAAHIEMRLPGFCFTAGGATAIVVGVLFLASHLATPSQQIAVYRFVDEQGQDFSLERSGTLEIHPDPRTSLEPRAYVDGHTLILIFPEQVPTATISVRDPMEPGRVFEGQVTYAGSRESVLRLGRNLPLRSAGGTP